MNTIIVSIAKHNMEIIQQINELIETNESLKEENRKFGDTLDEKDEVIQKQKEAIKNLAERYDKLVNTSEDQNNEINRQREGYEKLTEENKELDIKLAQKSNQLDLCDGKLSQDMNSLRSKLAYRDKRIEELEQQVTIKPNHMVSKDNEIAVLGEDLRVAKAKIQKMDGAMDEIIKSVNKIGYVKHKLVIGRYNNDKPKYKTCFLPEDIVQHLKECPQKAPLGGRPVV